MSKPQEAPRVALADPKDREGRLKSVGGSQSDKWNNVIVSQAINALWIKNESQDDKTRLFGAAVGGLVGIGPRDEIEGMLAAQLIASHNASMECFRRAMIGEQTFEGRRENLTQANKLSRTFTMLLDSLNRHRGKGQQKVTVEHVHVHNGGQAVVGMVETGGGGATKPEEQPHAKQIAHAPKPPMQSPNASRETLPIGRDA